MGEGLKTRRGKSKGDANLYLYNVGDENISLTGGWSLLSFYTAGTSLTQKKSSNIETNIAGIVGGQAVQSVYKTINKINFTGFAKLILEVEMSTTAQVNSSHSGRAIIDVYDVTTNAGGQQLPTSIAQTVKSITQNSSYTGVVELNTSAINGLHFVDVQAWYTNVNGNVKIKKVYFG